MRDVLGTSLLSVLSGHFCFAHVAALHGDTEFVGYKEGGERGFGASRFKAFNRDSGEMCGDGCLASSSFVKYVKSVDVDLIDYGC